MLQVEQLPLALAVIGFVQCWISTLAGVYYSAMSWHIYSVWILVRQTTVFSRFMRPNDYLTHQEAIYKDSLIIEAAMFGFHFSAQELAAQALLNFCLTLLAIELIRSLQ